MADITSRLQDYSIIFTPDEIKERIASKENINPRVQEILASSGNYSILLSLLYNPSLNVVIQRDFARRYQGLVAHDFINNKKSTNYKLKIKNLVILIDRMAANQNLDQDVQNRLAKTTIRLDSEASEYIENNRFDMFKREVLLYLLKADLHAIASTLLDNPDFKNQELRKKLASHFDIPLPEGPIWSMTKIEDAKETNTYNRTEKEKTLSYGSIWSNVKA
jgi:hypothetical protein